MHCAKQWLPFSTMNSFMSVLAVTKCQYVTFHQPIWWWNKQQVLEIIKLDIWGNIFHSQHKNVIHYLCCFVKRIWWWCFLVFIYWTRDILMCGFDVYKLNILNYDEFMNSHTGWIKSENFNFWGKFNDLFGFSLCIMFRYILMRTCGKNVL